MSDEHVVLADCLDNNNVLSSQIAYFNASGGGTPHDVAIVATVTGQAALWVCDTTEGLFTDTNTQFTATLGPKVADGGYAGTGSNGYDSNGGFRCWQTYSQDYYKYGDDTCSMVYNCNHDVAPSNTATAKCITATPSSSPTPSDTSDTSTTGLATGAVVGIGIGAGLALLIALGAAFLIWRHLKAQRRDASTSGPHIAAAGGLLARFKERSPLATVPDQPWQPTMQGINEMEGQDRFEVAATPRPPELAGTPRAELPTPESNYYLWYPAHGKSPDSDFEGPSKRQ